MMFTSSSIKKYATSKEILSLLGKGASIAIVLTSPYGGPSLIKNFGLKLINKAWEKYDEGRLKQSIKRMVDRKLLDVKRAGAETVITISEKGKRFLLQYNFQEMQLAKPKVWDRKWRIVIFDIYEEKRVLRDSLRKKIKTLGLFPFQKSVFITPYPCEKEIAFLRQYFGVGREVSCFTAINLEEEDFFKKVFNLT